MQSYVQEIWVSPTRIFRPFLKPRNLLPLPINPEAYPVSYWKQVGGEISGGATSMRGTLVLRASVGPKTDEWANEGKVIKTLYIDQQAPDFRGTA